MPATLCDLLAVTSARRSCRSPSPPLLFFSSRRAHRAGAFPARAPGRADHDADDHPTHVTDAPASRDPARATLAVLFIAGLIVASFRVLQPFLLAAVWATMIVVATWPLMLRVDRRWGVGAG